MLLHYIIRSPRLLSCPHETVHKDLEWSWVSSLLFTSGCLFITLWSCNETSVEELPQTLEFCQKCSPGFEIWLGLCVYIVRRRPRERWSFWHVLRKAITSHLKKTHPKRTGEMMGWWQFILKTLLAVKVTKLFKCLWIRRWNYRGAGICILPTMKIKSRNFIGHTMVLRYQKKKTSSEKNTSLLTFIIRSLQVWLLCIWHYQRSK